MHCTSNKVAWKSVQKSCKKITCVGEGQLLEDFFF
jgi:hypothetical protein